MFFIRLWFW